MDTKHNSVLLKESIDLLEIKKQGTYVDATGGGGGHAQEILKRLGLQGKLLVFDCDAKAVKRLKARFKDDKRCLVKQAWFSEIVGCLEPKQMDAIDGIIADFGFSSDQLDDPTRGLSFTHDGPIDMRLNQESHQTAATILADASEKELADIFFHFGEERRSYRLAKAIVYERQKAPIDSTAALKNIVAKALRGPKRPRIHPATKVFQALRIATNGELDEIKALLKVLPMLLKKGGRASLISFHSLEDRLVKNSFKELKKEQNWQWLTKKPLTPSPEEIKTNPRSRSAKLRAIERV